MCPRHKLCLLFLEWFIKMFRLNDLFILFILLFLVLYVYTLIRETHKNNFIWLLFAKEAYPSYNEVLRTFKPTRNTTSCHFLRKSNNMVVSCRRSKLCSLEFLLKLNTCFIEIFCFAILRDVEECKTRVSNIAISPTI